MKLRAAGDGKTPVEMTVVRLADESATPDCDLTALLDGQRVELPKAKLLKQAAKDDPNYRNVTVLNTQLSRPIVCDLERGLESQRFGQARETLETWV